MHCAHFIVLQLLLLLLQPHFLHRPYGMTFLHFLHFLHHHHHIRPYGMTFLHFPHFLLPIPKQLFLKHTKILIVFLLVLPFLLFLFVLFVLFVFHSSAFFIRILHPHSNSASCRWRPTFQCTRSVLSHTPCGYRYDPLELQGKTVQAASRSPFAPTFASL